MSEGVNNDTPATAGEEAAAGAPTPVTESPPGEAQLQSQPEESLPDESQPEESPPEQERLPPPPPSSPMTQLEETPVIHKHFIAPALIPLDRIDEDTDFLVRDGAELEDIAALATDIARLGQLFPIDV